MYTEDGFELRPVGDTMEVYASGEQFHETTPPVIAAFEALSARLTITKTLCDVRLAAYIMEPDELAERARLTALTLKRYRTAFVGLTDQRRLLDQTVQRIHALGGEAAVFSNKADARDWLAQETALDEAE